MTKRAIIHIENTDNILEFAEFLAANGWQIISANKTEDLLKKNKIPVIHESALAENNLYITDISQIHRKIVLTRYTTDENSFENRYDQDDTNIFIICLNVYPQLDTTVPESKLKSVIKPINFYITSVLRSAVTNYENILILTDPADYKEAMVQLRTDNITEKFRTYLAAKAMNLISAYDSGIATSVLNNKAIQSEFMNYLSIPFQKEMVFHNGANKHQRAAHYKYPSDSTSVNSFMKIQGKELSYNLLGDVSLAWEQISTLYTNLKTQFNVQSVNCDNYEFTTQFTPLTGTVFSIAVRYRAIVGASLSTNIIDSAKKTYTYDYENINAVTFGCSAVIDETAATELVKCNFAAIVAPGFTAEAKEIFSQNKNIRLIPAAKVLCSEYDGQLVNGGLLIQTKDSVLFDKWAVKTRNRPAQDKTDQMAFGTLLAMGSRSYSAVVLKDNAIVGISQACTSSLNAVNHVLQEATQAMTRKGIDISNTEEKIGDVLITDAEIPFCDAVKTLIDKGISAIIQTGGTAQDQEFIDYCNERGVAMVFTGMTHISF